MKLQAITLTAEVQPVSAPRGSHEELLLIAVRAEAIVVPSAEQFLGLGIGVMATPDGFERDINNVRDAVAEADVRFPVAFDPAYSTWNAYRNSYWPGFYFADKVGRIRHVHFGEGDYDGSEAVIRELLAEPSPA